MRDRWVYDEVGGMLHRNDGDSTWIKADSGLMVHDLVRDANWIGSYRCPHCAEDSEFDAEDLHSGCTFYCEHCGKPSVIEPRAVEESDA